MKRGLIYFVLLLGTVLLMAPLGFMLLMSVATENEAQQMRAGLGAAVDAFSETEGVTWGDRAGNYPAALKRLGSATALAAPGAGPQGEAPAAGLAEWTGFVDALANSVVITVLCVVGTVLSCSLVGYAFARLPFRGQNVLFLVMLGTMMLPVQVTMIPLFLLFRGLGWLDTMLPLVVPAFFGTAFFVFMFRQFFSQVPEELLESARVDGASELGVWWRVMLPVCKPVAAITAIFTFIWTWNDFMGPLIYLQSPEKYTLSLALNSFKGQYAGVKDANLLMAASIVTMLPCVLLFFAAQRYFVQGLTQGSVKG